VIGYGEKQSCAIMAVGIFPSGDLKDRLDESLSLGRFFRISEHTFYLA